MAKKKGFDVSDLVKELSSNDDYNVTSGEDSEALSSVKGFLSTGSISVDLRLGGGFAFGRIHECYGTPSSGKSALGYSTAIQCLNAGGVVFWIASEVAFDREKFIKMGGDPSKVVLSHPETLEDCFVYIKTVVKDIVPKLRTSYGEDIPVFMCWDSINGAAPANIVAGGDRNELGMGYKYIILADFCKWMTIPIAKSQVSFLILNQISANIGGGYGAPAYNSAGIGNSLKHTASSRLFLDWKGRDSTGQYTKFKIEKLRFEKSHSKWDVYMFYYTGFDKFYEIYELGLETEVLIRKAGWMYYGDERVGKSAWQSFIGVLADNPELVESLTTDITKAYLEIISNEGLN